MPARILLIQDNPADMELMAYLLRAKGHDVLYAHDRTEGLALASTARPDIIICDIHLPNLDGYAVARDVKNDPALRSIPVIAVIMPATEDAMGQLFDAGFDGYISKPLDPEPFVASIEKFLQDGGHTDLFTTRPH